MLLLLSYFCGVFVRLLWLLDGASPRSELQSPSLPQFALGYLLYLEVRPGQMFPSSFHLWVKNRLWYSPISIIFVIFL